MKEKKIVIVGDGGFAEIAFEYFQHDSSYEVVGFAVEKQYRKREELFGLPVVDFESVCAIFPPNDHEVFVAIVYNQVNRLRRRLCQDSKEMGYRLASFVSPRAFLWRNVTYGENCFIFENNVVQPFVTLGDGVILWSGNHIGHHSKIKDYVFVSSHVVISGWCNIEDNCFLGVNSSIGHEVTIGRDCWVGPGVTITRSAPENTLFRPNKPSISEINTLTFFKV